MLVMLIVMLNLCCLGLGIILIQNITIKKNYLRVVFELRTFYLFTLRVKLLTQKNNHKGEILVTKTKKIEK
jgi:hypothetical protein